MWVIFFCFLYGCIFGSILVFFGYIYGFKYISWFVHIISNVLTFLFVISTGEPLDTIILKRLRFKESFFGFHYTSAVDHINTDKQEVKEDGEREEAQKKRSEFAYSSPQLLNSLCKMSQYVSGDLLGTARNCRLVLFATHLVVNEVKSSQGVGAHERVVTHEQPLFRLNLDDIFVTSSYLQNNRRRKGATGSVYGNVLIFGFKSSPVSTVFTETSKGDLYSDPLFHTFVGAGRRASLIQWCEGGLGSNCNFPRTNSAYNSSIATAIDTTCSIANSNSNNYGHNGTCTDEVIYNDISDFSGGKDFSLDAYAKRHCLMAVRFFSLREQERWLSLLTGRQEATRWRVYLQTLPTPDVFNLILARLFYQNVRTTALANFMRTNIQQKLDELIVKKFPTEVKGRILLEDLILGDEVPTVSNVSFPNLVAKGEMSFDFDLLYRGGIMLCFQLNLTYCGFKIPYLLFSVKILHLSAQLRVCVGPPPSKKFWVGGLHPLDISVEVHQGVASGRGFLHRILTSLPDLSPIATSLIKLYFLKYMTLPVMDDFTMPNVEKKSGAVEKVMKNTLAEHFARCETMHSEKTSVKITKMPSSSSNCSCVVPLGVESSAGLPRVPDFSDFCAESDCGAAGGVPCISSQSSATRNSGQIRKGEYFYSFGSDTIQPSLVDEEGTQSVGDGTSELFTLQDTHELIRSRISAKARQIMRQAVRRVKTLPIDIAETTSKKI